MTLQNNYFFICGQLMRHPLIELFHLSNLLQMPDDCRTVDVEFFSNFSCHCERISFDDALSWLLSTSGGQRLYSSSRLSSPLQNFLNHHCTVCSLAIPGPNMLLMLWVLSAALWPILNSNKKIAQICFLSNIISSAKNAISFAPTWNYTPVNILLLFWY